MKKLSLVLALVLCLFAFASCTGSGEDPVEKQKAEILYVYNWGEYISDG